jgi:hypothetical protein
MIRDQKDYSELQKQCSPMAPLPMWLILVSDLVYLMVASFSAYYSSKLHEVDEVEEKETYKVRRED